ncbi:MAG: FHA domain-containing protein [Planctomycetota bacterium]
MLILIVAGGPDKGRTYELAQGDEVILGREGDQVSLSDHKVSRKHARLWAEGGRWYVEDLESKHGSFRNHERITSQAPLADGDYLQIGNTVLVLARMDALTGVSERAALLAPAGVHPRLSSRTRRTLLVGGAFATAALLALVGTGVTLQWQALNQQSQQAQDVAALKQTNDKLLATNAELRGHIDDRLALTEQRQRAVAQGIVTQLEPGMTALTQGLAESSQAQAALSNSLKQRDAETRMLIAALDAKAREDQRVLEEVAALRATASATDTTLRAIAHDLKHLPAGISTNLAARLDEALHTIREDPSQERVVSQLGIALAKDGEATRRLLTRVLGVLEEQPDAAAIAAALREEMAADHQRIARTAEQLALRLAVDGEQAAAADLQLAQIVRDTLQQNAAESDELIQRVLARLDTLEQQQPDAKALADQLREQLAADTAGLQRSMDRVLAELADSPKHDQLIADIQTVIRHDGRHAEAALTRVLDRLDDAPDGKQLADTLRLAMAKESDQAYAMLQRVLDELEKRPTAEQFASWTAEQRDANAKAVALLNQSMTKLFEQRDFAGELAQLRKIVEEQPAEIQQLSKAVLARLDAAKSAEQQDQSQVLAAIADLKDALPPDVSEPLQQAIAKLDRQLTQQQLAAAIERAAERVATAENQAVADRLKTIEARLDAAPNADDLKALSAGLTQQVTTLVADTTQTQALRELRDEVRQLAEDHTNDPLVERVLATVEQQRDTEAKLAEVMAVLREQPEASETRLKSVLAAVNAASADQTRRMLEEMLAELSKTMPTDESITATVRREVRDAQLLVQANREAMADALLIEAGPTRPDLTRPNTAASNTPRPRPTAEPRLSRTERAYRNAFISGRTIQLKSVLVDPSQPDKTSIMIPLDPAQARAAGFTDWREWYHADLEAQRTRLAKRLEQNRAAPAASANIIQLPDGDPNVLQQDTPTD